VVLLLLPMQWSILAFPWKYLFWIPNMWQYFRITQYVTYMLQTQWINAQIMTQQISIYGQLNIIATEVDILPCQWGSKAWWLLRCHNATVTAPVDGISRFKHASSVVHSLVQTDDNYLRLGTGNKEVMSAPPKLQALYGSFPNILWKFITHSSHIFRFKLACAGL
jgi:hypothetical protein